MHLIKANHIEYILLYRQIWCRRLPGIHETTPLASAGLGRVLTAAGLMGIMLKNDEDKLTLNFRGDGPAGQILATAYGSGAVKGDIADLISTSS